MGTVTLCAPIPRTPQPLPEPLPLRPSGKQLLQDLWGWGGQEAGECAQVGQDH